MKNVSSLLGATIAILISLPVHSSETAKPVRMGCGAMTFDTVPGWGLLPSGKSALGPTHGSVVVDKAGNIYTSAIKGVVVFSPDGTVINNFTDPAHTEIHDMKI